MHLLTPKERQVLLMLVQGMPYKQMSAQLFISPDTFKKHVKNIYRKINVNNRSEALMWLLQQLYPSLINVDQIKVDMDKRIMNKAA